MKLLKQSKYSNQFFAMFVTSCLVFSPNMSSAQALLSGSKTNTSGTSTATSSGGLGGTAYVPAQAATPEVTKKDAMLNNAKDAKDKQNNGQMVAMIAAGVMAATAAATCPACTKRGTCPICYGSLIGAAAAALTASQMSKAKNQSNQQAYDVNPVDTKDGSKDLVLGDTPAYQNVTKGINNAAKAAKVKVASDLSSITTPDGRTISTAGAVASPGSSGLSSGEQLALAAGIKAAQAQAAAKMGKDGALADGDVIEEYSGGGRGGGMAAAAADVPAVAAEAKAKERQPSSVEGAFKEYNGEKIGVAMDSMFEMMHRRYKHHAEDRQSFMVNQ